MCTPETLYAQYALQFGGSVAVSDCQILVGEARQLLLPDNVFVYELAEDSTWNEMQVLTPGGEVAAGFGRSLAAEHTTLAFGAPLASEVYLYSRSEDGSWELSETLTRPQDQFGASPALKGDRLLIGTAGGADPEGDMYLYSRDEHGFV